MFLRKLLKNDKPTADQKNAPPAGMQTMGANLQRKFAKGVQYNSMYIQCDRHESSQLLKANAC